MKLHTEEDAERFVAKHLANAWNAYCRLAKNHGRRHPDEQDEFRRAIHSAQGVLAVRIAQRADPEHWPTHWHLDPIEPDTGY